MTLTGLKTLLKRYHISFDYLYTFGMRSGVLNGKEITRADIWFSETSRTADAARKDGEYFLPLLKDCIDDLVSTIIYFEEVKACREMTPEHLSKRKGLFKMVLDRYGLKLRSVAERAPLQDLALDKVHYAFSANPQASYELTQGRFEAFEKGLRELLEEGYRNEVERFHMDDGENLF